MAIRVYLEDVLKERGMTSKELSALVGITEANLSILRSGKAKGVRSGTINRICYFLGCDVGDILKFDGYLALHCKDNEDNIALEGTVYVSTNHAGVICYINPVYQSTDGSVYVTAGNGITNSGNNNAEGVLCSTTLEETTTITENGKAKSSI